jgi:hypothetical protein
MHRPVTVGGVESRCTPLVVLTAGRFGGPPQLRRSILRWTSMVTELEEVPMSIAGGLDIHQKQLTFDWVDEQNGTWERGRISPADREHLADWLSRRLHASRPEAAGQDRQGRRETPARVARGRSAARVLHPAVAGPGVAGNAPALPGPAHEAHRLRATRPVGVFPPGRHRARAGRDRARRPGPASPDRRRATVDRRPATGQHRTGHDGHARRSPRLAAAGCYPPPAECRVPER